MSSKPDNKTLATIDYEAVETRMIAHMSTMPRLSEDTSNKPATLRNREKILRHAFLYGNMTYGTRSK